MATDDPQGKRPRLGSWQGPSQTIRLMHPPEHAQPYTGTSLPPAHAQSSQPYNDLSGGEHRTVELPDPVAHGYGYHQPGYTTSSNSVNGPPTYPPDQDFNRSSGTPVKNRSPNESQPHHQARPPPLTVNSSHEQPPPPPPPMQHMSAHPGAHPPPGYPPHESHIGVPNGSVPGPHHGLPIANPHEPLPSPALGHGGGYGQSPVSAGPRDLYMSGNPYAPSNMPAMQKRKAIRAQQACDQCRNRKAKCDEGRPACGFCRESNQTCIYREVPPPKQDRTLTEILENMKDLHRKVDTQGREIGMLREELHQRPFQVKEEGPNVGQKPNRIPPASDRHQDLKDDHGNGAITRMPAGDAIPQNAVADAQAVKSEDEDGGVGDLAIPMEHTTAAHKLLRWQSIRNMMRDNPCDENYVMELEEERGIIRLYGRGEGADSGDYGSDWTSDGGSSDPDGGAPCPFSHGVWGIGYAIPGSAQRRRRPYESIGGLNPDGSLNLAPATLKLLLQSYLDNIHMMHPFLDQGSLHRMVEGFSNRYNLTGPGTSNSRSGPRPPVPSPSFDTIPKKRKRVDHAAGFPKHQASSLPARRPPDKSVSTALVLLVLALGRICQHKEYLPGPVPTGKSPHSTGFSPETTSTVSPASSKQSPQAMSQASSFSSQPSPTSGGRRASIDSQIPTEKKALVEMNVDRIPGLAYYAFACEILGSVIGGNDLPHVQAFLLAGLYAGQLGRVFESWKWINTACTACQLLVRPSKLEKMDVSRRDFATCAFWTCLQLESDILAELDLPPSGISRLEEKMNIPTGPLGLRLEDADGGKPETLMWFYYLSQIALRKLLNRVHSALYKPKNKSSPHSGWSTAQATELDRQLQAWRDCLPPPLRWHEGADPPEDINAARLRAKYYGARYIIHRPFLHHVLHPETPQRVRPTAPSDSPSVNTGGSYSQQGSPPTSAPAGAAEALDRRASTAPVPAPSMVNSLERYHSLNSVDEKVRQACVLCVDSAMRSTSAFHGIGGRAIVTNIFGTAHAQFGNLLVLQAAYANHVTRPLVHEQELSFLLNVTVNNLKSLARISPVFGRDASILESTSKSLNLRQHDSNRDQYRQHSITPTYKQNVMVLSATPNNPPPVPSHYSHLQHPASSFPHAPERPGWS